jgi:hypothetical protein
MKLKIREEDIGYAGKVKIKRSQFTKKRARELILLINDATLLADELSRSCAEFLEEIDRGDEPEFTVWEAYSFIRGYRMFNRATKELRKQKISYYKRNK